MNSSYNELATEVDYYRSLFQLIHIHPLLNGRIKLDREKGELSLFPSEPFRKKKVLDDAGSLKCFSLSIFREMALSSSQFAVHTSQDGTNTEDNPLTHFSSHQPSRHTIDIPGYWTKDDLLDLKDYLSNLPLGVTRIWIRIHGIEKDTKFSIDDLDGLKEWVRKRSV